MTPTTLNMLRGIASLLIDTGETLSHVGRALDGWTDTRQRSHPAFKSNGQLDGIQTTTSGAGVKVRYGR